MRDSVLEEEEEDDDDDDDDDDEGWEEPQLWIMSRWLTKLTGAKEQDMSSLYGSVTAEEN